MDNDFGGIGAREQTSYTDLSFVVFTVASSLIVQVGLPYSVPGNVRVSVRVCDSSSGCTTPPMSTPGLLLLFFCVF